MGNFFARIHVTNVKPISFQLIQAFKKKMLSFVLLFYSKIFSMYLHVLESEIPKNSLYKKPIPVRPYVHVSSLCH